MKIEPLTIPFSCSESEKILLLWDKVNEIINYINEKGKEND